MDAAIKLQLKKIAERIDDMLLRERAMLFLVVMGVLYAFASMVFFAGFGNSFLLFAHVAGHVFFESGLQRPKQLFSRLRFHGACFLAPSE